MCDITLTGVSLELVIQSVPQKGWELQNGKIQCIGLARSLVLSVGYRL